MRSIFALVMAMFMILLSTVMWPKEAAAVNFCGFPANVSGQIATIKASQSGVKTTNPYLIGPLGLTYMLMTNGAIYGEPCAPYFGGANGQSYFAGKVAFDIQLHCSGDTVNVVGYQIITAANERYHYGNTGGRPC